MKTNINETDQLMLSYYRDNERKTNKLVCFISASFVLLSIFNEISLLISYKEGLAIANHYVFLPCCIFVIVTIIFSYKNNFDKPWIKYVLIGGFIVVCNVSFFLFTIYCSYFLFIPIVVSSRYFDKELSVFVLLITLILFFISCIIHTSLSGTSSVIDFLHMLSSYDSWSYRVDAINYIVFPISLVLIFIGYYCNNVTRNGLSLIVRQSEEHRKNSMFQNEMKFAAEIQKGTLPDDNFISDDGNFEICAGQVAAKEVCGDAYDYFMLNNHTLGFVVADVADKGVSAAMFMMGVRKSLKCAFLCSNSLQEAIILANTLICSDNPKAMFVTFWLGIIDTQSGIGQFVNAGHLPPVIKHDDGSYELITNEPDLFVGNFPNMPPKVYKLYMNKGDVMVVYTDGITDARNTKGDSFSIDSIIKIVNNCTNDPQIVRDSIINSASEFSIGTDQFDDMTLLVIKCNSTKPSLSICIENEATSKGIKKTIDSVDELLKSINCPEDIRRNIDVVVDEICTNISDYAYTDKGNIYLDIVFGNNYANLIFKDDGVSFNPLSYSEQEDNTGLKNGGWGIYLTKKLANEIDYQYLNNQNVLTIKFLWNILH